MSEWLHANSRIKSTVKIMHTNFFLYQVKHVVAFSPLISSVKYMCTAHIHSVIYYAEYTGDRHMDMDLLTLKLPLSFCLL